jgi:hypothetical protein
MRTGLNARREFPLHIRTPGCVMLWSGLKNSSRKLRSFIRAK